MTTFADRRHAGGLLAAAVAEQMDGGPELLVLALATGSVPLAWEVSRALRTRLDVFDDDRRARSPVGSRRRESPEGRRVVLVDDGLSTATTLSAAIGVIRGLGATEVTVAVPAARSETVRALVAAGERCLCAVPPGARDMDGPFYTDYSRITDAEVRLYLDCAGTRS